MDDPVTAVIMAAIGAVFGAGAGIGFTLLLRHFDARGNERAALRSLMVFLYSKRALDPERRDQVPDPLDEADFARAWDSVLAIRSAISDRHDKMRPRSADVAHELLRMTQACNDYLTYAENAPRPGGRRDEARPELYLQKLGVLQSRLAASMKRLHEMRDLGPVMLAPGAGAHDSAEYVEPAVATSAQAGSAGHRFPALTGRRSG
jgi:hypothetical protein